MYLKLFNYVETNDSYKTKLELSSSAWNDLTVYNDELWFVYKGNL